MRPRDVTTGLLEAVEKGLARRTRVLLAVSGGIDSMVLLDAATKVRVPELTVATFDHGTGPAATRAADLVRRRCAELGVACVSAGATDLVASEAAFRAARWSFLRHSAAELGNDTTIATAHTASDQVETVFLRVLRDAGARGLAGLFASSEIARPLLGVWRADVEAYAKARGVEWIDDPTNSSPRHARNRARHDLLPALRRVRPTIDAELLELARQAAQWRDDVDAYVDRAVRFERRATGIDIAARPLADQSPEALAILWPALAARAGVALDRRGIARLVQFATSGRVGARVQLSGGWEVVRSRDAFQLRASNLTDSPALAIPVTGCRWGAWSFRAVEFPSGDDAWSATLPADRPFTVRTWRPGDRMAVRPGAAARTVKRFLSKAGVTGHERAQWPVVLVGDQIVWIPGVRRSDAATARSGRPGLPFVCEHHTS